MPATLPATFNTAVTTREGITIIALRGELDIASVTDFNAAVETLPDGPAIVDLTDLSFVDSSGLGAFLSLARKARGDDRTVLFAGASVNTARVFEVTALTDVLRSYGTVDEALAAAK